MKPLHFQCRCPGNISSWYEEPAHSMHAYKVRCGCCERFIKWGSRQELALRLDDGEPVTVVPYQEPPAPASLERFMSDE